MKAYPLLFLLFLTVSCLSSPSGTSGSSANLGANASQLTNEKVERALNSVGSANNLGAVTIIGGKFPQKMPHS